MAVLFNGGSIAATIFLGLLVVLGYTWRRRRHNNLPPGPFSWPIIGALPNLIQSKRRGLHLHEYLTEVAAKYGNVCSLQLGSKLMVVLSDKETTRDVFQRADFVDRPASATKTVSTDEDPITGTVLLILILKK